MNVSEIKQKTKNLLDRRGAMSALQIGKELGVSEARINRVLLRTTEIHFNGFLYEKLPLGDPRLTSLSIKNALDSSNWFPTLFGQQIMHSWAEIAFLEQLLGHYKFSNVVELGTAGGGLTTLFMLHGLRTGAKTLSIDTGNEPDTDPYNTVKQVSNYTFLKGDAIKPSSAHHEIITSIIKQDGRTLLYCDANGYREARRDQMNHWVPHMKLGDVVISHDYPTQITKTEITSLIDTYNLKPFHQEEAWKLGCRVLTYERR